MCVANSARSQMAEGIAKKIWGSSVWIESAGSQPKHVNPYAIQAMRELGIDISKNYSKSYEDLSSDFKQNLNYVITLCAEEVCPVVLAPTATRLHWPHNDPAGYEGDEESQLNRFRVVRDQIIKVVEDFKIEKSL